MLHKDQYRKISIEKKTLVVSLKGPDAKTNWLAANPQSQNNFNFDVDWFSRTGFVNRSFLSQSFLNEDSFVRDLSVQLWSVNQRTTEAEKVTDS
jgi:hypothetical protein